ncbi:hypothetical protein CS369_20295 [Candidatus Symbiopectobacterium sp. 'North America']|nr:hypothetical protein [Candidatus Symbiopectobacterium sp. 'North America']
MMEMLPMKNAIKYLLLASILSLTAGVNSHIGYDRMYFDDPATGPDVGTPEWVHCQARGGCQ